MVAASVGEVVCFVEEVLAGDVQPRGDLQAFRNYYVPDSSENYAQSVSELVRQTLRLPHVTYGSVR